MTMMIFDHQPSTWRHTTYLHDLTQAEVNKLITWLSQAVMAQTGHLSITVTK